MTQTDQSSQPECEHTPPLLPYKIAVLCYLRDAAGRYLLLHRAKPPNLDLYSPIGGKLEMDQGESPTTCAVREIWEETGITITESSLNLVGIVSEHSFEDTCHWLMFCYEVTHAVTVEEDRMEFDEGKLEWIERSDIEKLPLPQTDIQVIWPAYFKYRGGGFFMVHLECSSDSRELQWRFEQSRLPDRT